MFRRRAGRGRLRPPGILIVDDAPVFRCVVRELLERRGYVVAGEADCGADALDLVQRLDPDAVLLDVHLPDETGFEVAARLAQARPGLPVLLTSADFDRNFYALADLAGARGFVPKSELAQVEFTMFWPSGAGDEAAQLAG
jgi:DNA-binding NarL/FixJ family response regulator